MLITRWAAPIKRLTWPVHLAASSPIPQSLSAALLPERWDQQHRERECRELFNWHVNALAVAAHVWRNYRGGHLQMFLLLLLCSPGVGFLFQL